MIPSQRHQKQFHQSISNSRTAEWDPQLCLSFFSQRGTLTSKPFWCFRFTNSDGFSGGLGVFYRAVGLRLKALDNLNSENPLHPPLPSSSIKESTSDNIEKVETNIADCFCLSSLDIARIPKVEETTRRGLGLLFQFSAWENQEFFPVLG